MPAPSATHLVLLPSYDNGPRLAGVVAEVLRHWQPVLVVIDGSTDGSEKPLQALAQGEPGLAVIVRPRNSGKGAAVLTGMAAVRDRGFTHALVMDADGQHSAEAIAGFMEASRLHPEAMVLGRPVFGPDVPFERLYGRKLTTGLVRLATLGADIADPLHGFRVYPVQPLLDALGPRRGGRGYDFDTEAAVRLFWAGVPPVNLPSPVRYFTRAEGGVSHFRYVRDNLILACMHLRLIGEMLLLLPSLARRRRMRRIITVLAFVLAAPLASGQADPLVSPAHRVAADDPAWRDLAGGLRDRKAVTADFTENRWFPFKRSPTVLKGEAHVSGDRGLSLHYLDPQERTVIIDDRGMIVRSAAGDYIPPADPRAGAADAALLDALRLDLRPLAGAFDIYGVRTGAAWKLALVPKNEDLRRTLGRISIEGEGAAVRRIEMRRSAVQRVEILISPPRSAAAFSGEELRRYFRAQ